MKNLMTIAVVMLSSTLSYAGNKTCYQANTQISSDFFQTASSTTTYLPVGELCLTSENVQADATSGGNTGSFTFTLTSASGALLSQHAFAASLGSVDGGGDGGQGYVYFGQTITAVEEVTTSGMLSDSTASLHIEAGNITTGQFAGSVQFGNQIGFTLTKE